IIIRLFYNQHAFYSTTPPTDYIYILSLHDALPILNESLKKDFWIRKPKIAVLGLNPHAGDNGLIGPEEQTIIIPAIEEAQAHGIDRKSTRLNSSHGSISYAVFCLKTKISITNINNI